MTGTTSYVVNVFAKNKPTTETLQVRRNPVNGVWEYSYKIIREKTARDVGKPRDFETLEVTEPEWRQTMVVKAK